MLAIYLPCETGYGKAPLNATINRAHGADSVKRTVEPLLPREITFNNLTTLQVVPGQKRHGRESGKDEGPP